MFEAKHKREMNEDLIFVTKGCVEETKGSANNTIGIIFRIKD
jgi:hypothetical protein